MSRPQFHCLPFLFYGDVLDGLGLLNLFLLGKAYVQDTFFNFCLNLIGIYVVGKEEGLLEFLVGEFAAQVAAVLLFFLVLALLFHFDVEVVLFIYMYLEVFLVQAGSGELYVVLFLGFHHVDGGGGVSGPFHPAIVKKVVENVGQPAVVCSSYNG